MSRFEAAALLNACLDRITEVTDVLKRLMKEFEKELAVLKDRVDGLEARVGKLEATQFSTTIKLPIVLGCPSLSTCRQGALFPKSILSKQCQANVRHLINREQWLNQEPHVLLCL